MIFNKNNKESEMISNKNNIVIAAVCLSIASSSTIADEVKKEFYASLRIGVASTDIEGGESQADVVSRYSRIGFKGETTHDNGLKAFGRYEYQIDAAIRDDGANRNRNRLGYVGLEGNFGRLSVGLDYHTFYDFIVGPADWPWDYSGFAMVEYRGRTEESLTYFKNTGNFEFGATLRLEADRTEEDTDETELAAAYKFGGTKLALGHVNFNDDSEEDIFAFAISGNAGPVKLAANYQTQDVDGGDDKSSLTFNAVYSGIYLHYEMRNQDNNPEPNLITIGYTHKLGKNTSMWFEYADFDNDQATGSIESIQAILKYDI